MRKDRHRFDLELPLMDNTFVVQCTLINILQLKSNFNLKPSLFMLLALLMSIQERHKPFSSSNFLSKPKSGESLEIS